MKGSRFYVLVLVTMTLLAALGVWVIIDGARAWQSRPRVDAVPVQPHMLSSAPIPPVDFCQLT